MELMTIDEMRQHEWFVSWSGGKDSTATIILMHEHKIPIKKIIYVRMMWDEELPATLPIMTDFVDSQVEKIRGWGYNLEIVPTIKSAEAYAKQEYFKSVNPEFNGNPYGITAFTRGHCRFSGEKVRTIKSIQEKDAFEMIGYRSDETERLKRLGGKKQSILATLGITEEECFDICKRNDMLSPLYGIRVARDGCWFCPNCGKKEITDLKEHYPNLYQIIVDTIHMCDPYKERMYSLMWGYNNFLRDYLDEKRNGRQMTFEEYMKG